MSLIADRTTESPLEIPGFRRTFLMLARALRFRCPNCGRGKVLAPFSIRHWAAVRDRCESCALRFDRGDGDYFFSGARFSNLLIAELLFAVGFTWIFLATYPDVPWDALTYGGAAAMVLAPILLFPFSKVLWLALDIMIRPVTPDELVDGVRSQG